MSFFFLLLARGSATGSATRDAGGADLSGGAREFSEGDSLTRARGVSVFFCYYYMAVWVVPGWWRRRRSRFERRAHDFSEG